MRRDLTGYLRGVLTAAPILLAAGGAYAQEGPAEVIHWMLGPAEAAALGGVIKAYEADGGKWVDSGVSPSTLARQVQTQRLVSGDPPTAMQLISKFDAMEMVESDMLGDISDVAKADGWVDVLPASSFDVISNDGQVYGVPFEFQMTNVLWYSKSVFDGLGIAAPQSFDDLISALDTIQAKTDIVPFANQSEDSSWRNTFNFVFAAAGGPELYNAVYRDRDLDAVRSPEFRVMAEKFKSLKKYTDESAAARRWNEAIGMVISGGAGVGVVGTWAKGEFTRAEKVAGKDFGCSILNGAPIVNSAMMVFPKHDEPEQIAAQKHLARIFMDPKVQSDFALIKGGLPTRIDADTSQFDYCGQAFVGSMRDHPDRVVLDAQLHIDSSTMASLIDLAVQYWADTLSIDEFVERFAEQLSRAQTP